MPVGLTRWHHPDLRPYTDAEAAVVLAQALDWQARLRAELGIGFVYPSDEWFLRAGVPVPPVEAYDDLLPALVENGVGMVRLFLDGWDRSTRRWRSLAVHTDVGDGHALRAGPARKSGDVCGDDGMLVEVVAVPNRAFGETVTVAGLLTVGDIVEALSVSIRWDHCPVRRDLSWARRPIAG